MTVTLDTPTSVTPRPDHAATTFGARLRHIRHTMRLSQTEFAALVQRAGDAIAEPNQCNKRLIQKWESGEHGKCHPYYRRALTEATGIPYHQLCAPEPDQPQQHPDLIHTAQKLTAIDTRIAQLTAEIDELRQQLGLNTATRQSMS